MRILAIAECVHPVSLTQIMSCCAMLRHNLAQHDVPSIHRIGDDDELVVFTPVTGSLFGGDANGGHENSVARTRMVWLISVWLEYGG